MPVYSHARGYYRSPPEKASAEAEEREKELFRTNNSLILEHEPTVMDCADYFFCPVSFGLCSAGNFCCSILVCAFRLGHLLIAWKAGVLIDQCPACSGKVLVTSFGGVRSYWWRGFCVDCQQWCHSKSNAEVFDQRETFVRALVTVYPDRLEQWQEYDGCEFDWVDGLRPAKKKRWMVRMLYNPASLEELIDELRTGRLRLADPPVEGFSQQEFKDKFSQRQLGPCISSDGW